MVENQKPTPQQVIDAVEVIKDHLKSQWISEGCEKDQAFGCASCQAVRLSNELDSLANWLKEDGAVPAVDDSGDRE